MLTMGSTKLWFPSRRSVESHRGALLMTLEGHWRSGRSSGLNCLYLRQGSLSLWAGCESVRELRGDATA